MAENSPDDRIDQLISDCHATQDAVEGESSALAISSLRLPGPELPELRAIILEGEKVHNGPLGPVRWREDEEIRSWFDGWGMIEPGMVPLGDWRPPVPGHTPYPELQHSFSGGVAKKR